MRFSLHRYIVLFVFLCICGTQLSAQGTQTTFGKNRVQYHDFEWLSFSSPNFKTYYYIGGQDIGKFAIEIAEKSFIEIEEKFEYRIDRKIEIIVYNDLTDLKQSNIGLNNNITLNTGGQTQILNNKMFVYFDGNHNELARRIRMGVAEVFMKHMMFGGNIQEILQNAVLLNLPAWFEYGLINFVGKDWTTENDNRLRDGFASDKYSNLNRLTEEETIFLGHSIWYYIYENYGVSTVTNLLYLTRINRSVDNGFLYVLGLPMTQVMNDWYNFYARRYKVDTEGKTIPNFDARISLTKEKRKQQNVLSQPKISPDAKQLAYVQNDIGKIKVWVKDLESNKEQRVLKFGFRNLDQETDYKYPLLAWSPDAQELAIIYEVRDVIKLTILNPKTGEKNTQDITKYQRVNSLSYGKNKRQLLLSATTKIGTNIYTYSTENTKSVALTRDVFDDKDPTYIKWNAKKGVVFSSNRVIDSLYVVKVDSILPVGNFDLFFYDFSKKSIHRITDTEFANESEPIFWKDSLLVFLSDENGIKNRYLGELELGEEIIQLDSVNTRTKEIVEMKYAPTTNLANGIQSHDVAPKRDKLVSSFTQADKYFITIDKTDSTFLNPTIQLQSTSFRNSIKNKVAEISEEKNTTPKEEPKVIVKEDFFFETPFDIDTTESQKSILEKDESNEKDIVKGSNYYKGSRVVPYRVKFATDYITTSLDNSFIGTGYDNFTSGGSIYQYPRPSLLLSASITDLFEDYRITGGVKVPLNFNGMEYFLIFDNNKKRLDKSFTFYRRTQRQDYDFNPLWPAPVRGKIKTHLFENQLKWPLDIYRSVRATSFYRDDRIVFQSTDVFSDAVPDFTEKRVGLKLEYVFDNTIDVMLNIKQGTRYKFYAEFQKQFDLTFRDSINFKFNDGYLLQLGFDVRHYQKVSRQITWATRFAGSTSLLGSQKVLHYLGGVDNWLFSSFDNDVAVPQSNDFAYQTIATNLRGFPINVRNGSSYAVLNTELRFPIATYLAKRPPKSEFLRNLQLIGFIDAGTAWLGNSPYADDNPLNTQVIENGPVELTVNVFKNPVVAGYGFGARSMLFGYFIRTDVAWGVDSGEIVGPRWYFSIGLDF